MAPKSVGTPSHEAQLTNKSLSQTIKFQDYNNRLILYSRRGCRYRWPRLISLTNKHGITGSMFAEVWSADNAGCKKVFGYLNRECSYGKDYAVFFWK